MTNTVHKRRILVVDDDISIRTLYSRVLTNAGFEVETAHDGRTAIELLARCMPDLVILDLVMPEQEGIETLLELQAGWPNLPVVAISGALGAGGYLHVASLLGAGHTLTKPIKPEQLLDVVRNVFQAEATRTARG